MLFGKAYNSIVYYIKSFFERVIWLYKSSEVYRNWIRNTTIVVLSVAVIWFLVSYLWYSVAYEEEFFQYSVEMVFVFMLSWVVLVWLITFISLPMEHIDQNIDSLPSKVWENKVVIEYDPPKWLSPSEVWILYTLTWVDSNLHCMIYKWEYEWLVKRIYDESYQWWKIKRLWELKYHVPDYERKYWNYIFWVNHDEEVLEAKIWSSQREIRNVYVLLVWSLVDKWLISVESNKKPLIPLIILALLFIAILLISPMVCFSLFIVLVILYFKLTSWRIDIWNLKRTKKWDEAYAHILWYKFFLEHCEERQLKKLLKEDPSYKDKVLPYVVALRLDWELLYKNYSI